MIKLSICITVFNQIAIVKKNLDNLIRYKGSDIEIIVSDDNSTDDICGLVNSYSDSRLVYTKTACNSGHDLNILHAIEKARGTYVLVLRSRDTLIVDNLEDMINIINEHDTVGYCVFSSVDDDGKEKTVFNDKLYKKGKAAIEAHKRLFIHPSGNIYRKELIDIPKLRNYIESHFKHKYGFCVHELIRMELASKSDFYTSKCTGWIYSNTIKQRDVAVNSIENGNSVYSPVLSYERLDCQLDFINSSLFSEKEKRILNKYVIQRFYKMIAYDFIKINENPEMQRHYNYKKVEFNAKRERRVFRIRVSELLLKNDVNNRKELERFMRLYSIKISFYYPVRDFILSHLFSRKSKMRIAKFLRRL